MSPVPAPALVPVLSAVLAAALAFPAAPRLPPPLLTAPAPAAGHGWMHRYRWLWALLAGWGAVAFVGGAAGPVAGLVVAAGTRWLIGRAEPPELRRRRAAVRRDLPHLVNLFAATLRGGASPGRGVDVVCAALPGPAADRLSAVAARLALGVDPGQVWASLADDPELAPLGRTLARAHATGAPVVASVERLADELGRVARAETEERARAVGVKAALPLGLCLLPAFLLLGIVPLVAGLASALAL